MKNTGILLMVALVATVSVWSAFQHKKVSDELLLRWTIVRRVFVREIRRSWPWFMKRKRLNISARRLPFIAMQIIPHFVWRWRGKLNKDEIWTNESKKRMERNSFSLLEYVLSTLQFSPKRKEVKSDTKLM